MAIKFEELRKYVARNVRLSICFEDGYYHDYLMMSDIPEQKYAGFYIYESEWWMWNFPEMSIWLCRNRKENAGAAKMIQ